MTTTIYSRIFCGKLLLAHVIRIENGVAEYYFENPKSVIKEYDQLFLSVFSMIGEVRQASTKFDRNWATSYVVDGFNITKDQAQQIVRSNGLKQKTKEVDDILHLIYSYKLAE